ncbi:MAG: SH3 domain-containing protein [Candidatus Latescibacterota bacterium]
MLGKRAFILMLTCVGLILCFSSVLAQAKKGIHAPDALPGVEPEMLSADYWIALQSDPDKVIMTPAEIEKFNEKVRTKRVEFKERYGKKDPLEPEFVITEIKGPVMNPLLPLNFPETLPGDSLRVRLKSNVDWLYSRDFYDNRNVIYNDRMKQQLADAMNQKALSDVIKRRFGVIVNNAMVRHYPTSVPGYNETQWEMDMFQAVGITTNTPVAILHESLNGDFLYIESPVSRGWVAAENIAIADRETVRKLTQDKNFLLCTGNKVPVYGDPGFKNFARYLYFSATIPLIKKDASGYTVKMAWRKPDGSLGLTNGYIKPDADVHLGYLPYTKRNVLVQIFKLLGQPYGWADQDNKRDCSGTQRVLFACFGIITGRHPSFILNASDHQYFMDPALSHEEKLKKLEAIEPVITVAGNSGHIVLYLGKAKNGKQYYIHQAGWGYDDEEKNHCYVNRVTVSDLDHKFYSVDVVNVYTTMKL